MEEEEGEKGKFEQKGERVSIMLRTLKRTLEYSLRQVESSCGLPRWN